MEGPGTTSAGGSHAPWAGLNRASARVTIAPLGISLSIELDRADDLAAVSAACEAWRVLPDRDDAALRIKLARSPDLTGTGDTRIAVEGREMHLHGTGAEGWAHADRPLGECTVSGDYLAAPGRLREQVLEPLMLFLLARGGRTPIHAAGFIAGDLAILAAGPSGAGKSCLAFAADAAGWPVLSDDTIYLERQPTARVWGWPGAVHLLPRDCAEPAAKTRLRGGKLKHAVHLGARSSCASATRATLCVLARGERAALEPLDPAEAMRRLAHLEPGFDLLARDIEEAHAFLSAEGAWLLTLSERPAEAIELLAANLPRLRKTAVP